jgi:hypothetical protein
MTTIVETSPSYLAMHLHCRRHVMMTETSTAPRSKNSVILQLQEGATALVVCGTTGEAPTLGPAEHRTLIRIAAGVSCGRVPQSFYMTYRLAPHVGLPMKRLPAWQRLPQ